jgi:hypothetical protein
MLRASAVSSPDSGFVVTGGLEAGGVPTDAVDASPGALMIAPSGDATVTAAGVRSPTDDATRFVTVSTSPSLSGRLSLSNTDAVGAVALAAFEPAYTGLSGRVRCTVALATGSIAMSVRASSPSRARW